MNNLIHFDYLGLTLHPSEGVTAMIVAAHLSAYLKEDFDRDKGLKHYDNSYRFPTSASMVLYGGVHQKGTIHIVLSGMGCRALGEKGIRSFCDYLQECGRVVCARLDIAVDVAGLDWRREISDIAQHVISPYVQKRKEVITANLRDVNTFDSRTLYFGSRQSPRMVRIYGKLADEQEPYTRCEIECKQELAQGLYGAFMASGAVQGLAVAAFDQFFAVETFLGVELTKLDVPLDIIERRRVGRSIAWALSCSGALTSILAYYGQSNFLNMLKEREIDRKMAKSRGKRKTPVGNTGVTNINFPTPTGFTDTGEMIPPDFPEFRKIFDNYFENIETEGLMDGLKL